MVLIMDLLIVNAPSLWASAYATLWRCGGMSRSELNFLHRLARKERLTERSVKYF